MCTKSVQFFIKRSSSDLVFAPLFGVSFKSIPMEKLPNPIPDSIITWSNGELRTKTDAIIALKPHVNFFLKIGVSILQLIPKRVRNWGYDFIASHRSRKGETCLILPPEQQYRILP
ncbi:MAG: putative DCC family thiol-disulfide oxidoreductase YuxK [Sphingobacteriales bacterium]|jgi:predicted DCC family thiol-disulfide oxidoreductase YuxK